MKYLMILLAILMAAQPVQAAVMSSSNYQMEQDSINFAGTDNSASSNYSLSDTLGEVATGSLASDNYNLQAGYRQMDAGYITITQQDDIDLSPDIVGMSAGTANGTGAWTVVTDNGTGYTLKVKASTSPAMQSGTDTIADYVPTGTEPDYDWTIASSAIGFGFTPEGTNVVQRYLDDGSDCNTGSSQNTDQCWDGLSTTDKDIASSTASNEPAGVATTVKFRVENGATHFQPSGNYTGVVTLTAVTN